MSPGWFDLVIIAVLLISSIMGVIRGFIKETFALLIWGVALFSAYHYHGLFDTVLSHYVHDVLLRSIIGFIVILLAVVFIGGIINNIFGHAIRRSGLGGTDRLLGIGFGFIRGVLVISFILLAVKLTQLPYQQYTKDSRLYAYFDPVVSWMESFTPDVMEHIKTWDKNNNNNITGSWQTSEKSSEDQQKKETSSEKNIKPLDTIRGVPSPHTP